MTELNSTDKASDTPVVEPILIGKSAELFPDLEEHYQAESNQKTLSKDTPPVAEETPKDDVKPNADADAGHPDKDSKQMYKVKVDGIETEVDADELVKGYQTQKALSQRGQKLADERREFESLRTNPVPEAPKDPIPTAENLLEGDDEYYKEFISPYVNPLKEQIKKLSTQLEDVQSEMRPARYNTVQDEIEQEMKTAGFDDYKEKLPEIELAVQGMSKERQGVYNNKDGFVSIFKSMKLDELKNAKNIAPTKVITDDDKRAKPDVDVMDGGVTPSNADDSSTAHSQAFQKANESGDWQDWAKVLDAKGYSNK